MNQLDEPVPHPYSESDYLPLRNAYEAARTQFGEDKVALPFVPYVGNKYRQSRERLLLIGKATFGWSDSGEDGAADRLALDRRVEHSRNFVESGIWPGDKHRYWSPFWSFAVRAACAVHDLGAPGEHRTEALERIAWTNLIKIGAWRGNATHALLRAQAELCVELLAKELAALQPTVVLITTGSTYSRLVYRQFGKYETWCRPAQFSDRDLMTQPHGSRRVFWTRHPQGASNDLLGRYLELLTADSRRSCGPGGFCTSSN